MQGHVVLVVFCRLTVLIGINAEDTEICRLARPHPVVRVATELAQALGDGEDQTDVAVLTVVIQQIHTSALEGLGLADDAFQAVLLSLLLGAAGDAAEHGSQELVVEHCLTLATELVSLGFVGIDLLQFGIHLLGDILAALPYLHVESLGRALFLMGAGNKAITQDVVFGG